MPDATESRLPCGAHLGGQIFDLSAYAKEGRELTYSKGYRYRLKVCDPLVLSAPCNNMPAQGNAPVAIKADSAGNCQQVLGQAGESATTVPPAGTWALLDASDPGRGVSVTYTDGSACTNAPQHRAQTTIEVRCVAEGAANSYKVTKVAKQEAAGQPCAYRFIVNSHRGCPVSAAPSGGPSPSPSPPGGGSGSGGSGWVWTFVLVCQLVFIAYMAGGWCYNYRFLGATGVEAIPHVDFWRALPARVARACVGARQWCGERLCGWPPVVHGGEQLDVGLTGGDGNELAEV